MSSGVARRLVSVTRPESRTSLDVVAETVRIDTWLWAARFFKTRSLATKAVVGGHVEINQEPCKPSKPVGPGDRVRVKAGRTVYDVAVVGIGHKRGSAKAARQLYEETAASRAERERVAEQLRVAPPLGSELSGRPTKRDRRLIEKLRRSR
jgi:ribosome-associated heat shock protein Hsp15